MTTMSAVEQSAARTLRAESERHRGDAVGEMTAMWRVAAEQGWHLLGVPEHAGGMGGTLADLAGVVRAITACGLSTPLPELHAGFVASAAAEVNLAAATEGRVGVAMPQGAADLLVPWGRHLDSVCVLLTAEIIPVDHGHLRQRANLAHEPADELPWRRSPLRATEDRAPAGATDVAANRWRVLHAARLVGAIEATARRTARYATQREQFGRPIAQFQAVAALVAEAHAQSVLAAAALDAAVVTEAHADPAARDLAATAVLATAARAAGVVARTAHQVHGAIGVTREMGLERFTRRLWAWRDTWQTEYQLTEMIGAFAEAGEPSLWSIGQPRHEMRGATDE